MFEAVRGPYHHVHSQDKRSEKEKIGYFVFCQVGSEDFLRICWFCCSSYQQVSYSLIQHLEVFFLSCLKLLTSEARQMVKDLVTEGSVISFEIPHQDRSFRDAPEDEIIQK